MSDIVKKLLLPFKKEVVSKELQKKIYDVLSEAKEEGLFSAPFKVVLRQDPEGVYSPSIEVLLETKAER